jgi:hypothetical protein
MCIIRKYKVPFREEIVPLELDVDGNITLKWA